MRFLVVGLGSMGKRRIRNLQALGHKAIAGFDIRNDRCTEAAERYDIAVYGDFGKALEHHKPDALIISTSPAHHMTYAWAGFEHGLPCFIEASVVEGERILELHRRTGDTTPVMAPSCTMRYYPGPKRVKQLIRSGAIGRPLDLNYHVGQYLPDWHPWERIEDFYVSARSTGACRELIPFELTWLNDIFGDPEPRACVKAKLTDINADIDDVYHCVLRYPDGVLASLTIEVISRPRSTRELRVLGTEGQLVFSGEENCVRYAAVGGAEWTRFPLATGTVQEGYINPEEPYVAELGTFVEAVRRKDRNLFPNTLFDDYRVLRTLERLEELSGAR
jgi:predicted dehydrogenase